MAEVLLTIQEASKLSGKSIQTIRRAIKAKKIESKRKKTAQGFNYLITRESLLKTYKVQPELFEREKAGLGGSEKNSQEKNLPTEYASTDDLKQLQKHLEGVLSDFQNERENFMRLMKAFQDRFVVLENQLKLLEQPQKKRWYHFWR